MHAVSPARLIRSLSGDCSLTLQVLVQGDFTILILHVIGQSPCQLQPRGASAAIHGLSFLNVYWMQLGIAHQRIRPASPQHNGAHERMHRTLERQAIRPVRQTCSAQQRNFDTFRREFNDERPHEALGQTTPTSHCSTSPQPYPSRLPQPAYPGLLLVTRMTTGGTFEFGTRLLYLANALTNQQIGLEETEDGLWSIYFHWVLLATLDERAYIIQS